MNVRAEGVSILVKKCGEKQEESIVIISVIAWVQMCGVDSISKVVVHENGLLMPGVLMYDCGLVDAVVVLMGSDS
jgi:hypothetical protein